MDRICAVEQVCSRRTIEHIIVASHSTQVSHCMHALCVDYEFQKRSSVNHKIVEQQIFIGQPSTAYAADTVQVKKEGWIRDIFCLPINTSAALVQHVHAVMTSCVLSEILSMRTILPGLCFERPLLPMDFLQNNLSVQITMQKIWHMYYVYTQVEVSELVCSLTE